jgi:fatty acid amide hydrolase
MADLQEQSVGARADATELSASAIAARIRAGELSAQEAVEAHIQRIEAVNPQLNAVVVPLFEQARAEARAADAARARGESLGPLHGVPITIKDQFMVAGTPTTWGLPSQAGHRAEADGPLVGRLRQAGAIVLGKTNVPQLLYYAEADNPVYGRTNNPWNLQRAPGGSSGGEGAIIAAGGSTLGLGGDIGGSLRVPAHFCGLCTLKPTSGRLTNLDSPTHLSETGQEAIRDQEGPLARTVADVALAMRVVAAPGQERFDPTVPPVLWRESEDGAVEGLRVAVYDDDGFFPAAPAVRRATREAAAALQARGAVIEEWTPPDACEGMRLFIGLLGADRGTWARRLLGRDRRTRQISGLLQIAGMPSGVRGAAITASRLAGQRRLADTFRSLRPLSVDEYWQMIAGRTRYRARFLAALDAGRYDAVVCPPHALPALTHGASYYLSFAASYSMLYNLLGMPAGVVPATRVRPGEESDRPRNGDIVDRTARVVERGSAGLPVGVQVVARWWREDVALAVMAALEEHFRAQPDFPARPPVPA